MYLINSNDKFFLKSLNSILQQKNFPILNESQNNNYGEIKFDILKNKILIEFEKNNLSLKAPISFNVLWKNILFLMKDNQINFGTLSYFPMQETLSLNDKKLKVRHTHNQIIRQALQSRGSLISKVDLYKSIWPKDIDIHINKLDTHLTNLKNLLKENFNYDFLFKSQSSQITFLIN